MTRKLAGSDSSGPSRVISVRFDDALLADVRKMAAEDCQSVSDWVRNVAWWERARRQVEAAPAPPPSRVGWQCEHLTMTSIPGVLGPVSAWCGCEMRPVYAA